MQSRLHSDCCLHASRLLQVLLQAAVEYERASVANPERFPCIIIIVTGKGPEKAAYLRQLSAMHFERVALRTAWLDPGDYCALLAAADLGVSLHASSSDLDLPMKVSDMLGWCVPSCTLLVYLHLEGCRSLMAVCSCMCANGASRLA